MKFTLVIDPDREEEVIAYAHRPTALTEELCRVCAAAESPLVGYDGADTCLLSPDEVTCFFTEGEKVFALTARRRWQVKCRLYELEEILPSHFVRIHKSCIANLRQVSRFTAVYSGALQVTFKGGHTDYVSRRQVRIVKERLGMK